MILNPQWYDRRQWVDTKSETSCLPCVTAFPDWLDFSIAQFSIPQLQWGACSQCKHDRISYPNSWWLSMILTNQPNALSMLFQAFQDQKFAYWRFLCLPVSLPLTSHTWRSSLALSNATSSKYVTLYILEFFSGITLTLDLSLNYLLSIFFPFLCTSLRLE